VASALILSPPRQEPSRLPLWPRFSNGIEECGYRAGAVVIEASLFMPQSRERVFVVAVDADAYIPAALVADGPNALFHPAALAAACKRMRHPLWWRLPVPPKRNSTFADIVEDEPTGVLANRGRIRTPARSDESSPSGEDLNGAGHRVA
jgi:site-specific DNA-cytosine methylase